jgi:uncharacterized protein YjiS (DUF1127 family)
MAYMSSIDDPYRIAGSKPAMRSRPATWRSRALVLGPLLLRGVSWLMELQRRDEMRQQVREMDERMLRDIGARREDLLAAIDREPLDVRSWRMRGWGM